jgi:hypothetical protein
LSNLNSETASKLVTDLNLAENLSTNEELAKFLSKEEAEAMAKMANAAT